MLERCNNGYEMRKTGYPTKNVESTVFDDARQTSIFCFYPKSTPSKLNHRCKNIPFDFLVNPSFPYSGLNLTWATLHFVGWVNHTLSFVGFRYTQPNLHFISSIAQCETQQWPILEPSPLIPTFHYSNCERSELIWLMGQSIFFYPIAQFVRRHIHQAGSFRDISTGRFHGFSNEALGCFIVVQSIFCRLRG